MAELELSFGFSNYLAQVNRFFNQIIQQFAATGNPGNQRLFESLCCSLIFSCQQSIFLSSSGEIFYFISNFLETDVPACPVFFFITRRNQLFIELGFFYYLVMFVATTTLGFSTVHECIIQCIVPYIKSIPSSGLY